MKSKKSLYHNVRKNLADAHSDLQELATRFMEQGRQEAANFVIKSAADLIKVQTGLYERLGDDGELTRK